MNTIGKVITTLGLLTIFACWITAAHPYVKDPWATWYFVCSLFVIPFVIGATELWGFDK